MTRYGWHLYYARRYCLIEDPANRRQAADLAVWYLLLSLAFGGEGS